MTVLVSEIIKAFELQVINAGLSDKAVEEFEINRPGLQLSGFYEYFQPKRVQVLGNAECNYLKSMTPEKRMQSCEKLLSHPIPCLIIANKNVTFSTMLACAKKYQQWLLATTQETSTFKVDLTLYLQKELAESIQIHGTLVDVYGVGVLITGESGVGKSETALSLIQNNHILIADDSVILTRLRSDMLIGSGPQLTQDLLEIRGVGIINIRSLYGLRAVRSDKKLDIIIHLENWDESASYERLGEVYATTEILGIKFPFLRIPVHPGRTLASIIEAAAVNYRQNQMGENSVQLLEQRMLRR